LRFCDDVLAKNCAVVTKFRPYSIIQGAKVCKWFSHFVGSHCESFTQTLDNRSYLSQYLYKRKRKRSFWRKKHFDIETISLRLHALSRVPD